MDDDYETMIKMLPLMEDLKSYCATDICSA